MNIVLSAGVVLASNAVLNFINNITVIVIAAITLLAIGKLAPLILKGRATQIITTVAVISVVVYFANNTEAFNSIGNFFANMFK